MAVFADLSPDVGVFIRRKVRHEESLAVGFVFVASLQTALSTWLLVAGRSLLLQRARDFVFCRFAPNRFKCEPCGYDYQAPVASGSAPLGPRPQRAPNPLVNLSEVGGLFNHKSKITNHVGLSILAILVISAIPATSFSLSPQALNPLSWL